MNTCFTCRKSFMAWAQCVPGEFPTHHLRCWPDGDWKREQEASIPCLKWQEELLPEDIEDATP